MTTFDPAKCTDLRINNHGGSCCGISHISGFPARLSGRAGVHTIKNADEGERRVRYLIGSYWTTRGGTLDKNKNRLYEVVLQDSQRKTWEPTLLRIGFKLVTEFTNTNSGNRVFVYHYAMGPKNEAGAYVSPYEAERKTSIFNPFKQPLAGAVHY